MKDDDVNAVGELTDAVKRSQFILQECVAFRKLLPEGRDADIRIAGEEPLLARLNFDKADVRRIIEYGLNAEIANQTHNLFVMSQKISEFCRK